MIEREKKHLILLNTGTLEFKTVEALSCFESKDWYVPGEGTFSIGHQLFESMAEVRAAANAIIAQRDAYTAILRNRVAAM